MTNLPEEETMVSKTTVSKTTVSKTATAETAIAETAIERLTDFRNNDLADLCDTAEAAIEAGGGFGWLIPPTRASGSRRPHTAIYMRLVSTGTMMEARTTATSRPSVGSPRSRSRLKEWRAKPSRT